MKKMTACVGVVCVSSLLLLSGCATSSQGSKTYSRAQAQQSMQVFPATVMRISEVRIQGDETGAGAVIGAVAGGVIGSTVGGGDGTKLAEVGGALAGGAIGSAAETKRRTKAAWEIEVELDDGRIMNIVQEQDDTYVVGDRIRVLQAPDGTMRVRH